MALDEGLAAKLRAIISRLRMYLALQGAARLLAFLVLAAFAQFAVDYGSRGLRTSIRAALLAGMAVTSAVIIWRQLIRPLSAPVSPADIANLMERRSPQLTSLLVSAVRFARGDVGPASINSGPLMQAVVQQANREVQGADFGQVLNSRGARRSGVMVLGTLLVAALTLFLAPEFTTIWFSRNVFLRDVEWPRRTHLIVDLTGGELVGARGDDLVIQASAQGDQPREVEFAYTTASGKRGRETMATVGAEGAYHYRFTFKNAAEDFDFYLLGGDDITSVMHARLLERPHVDHSEITIVSPKYSKLPPAKLGDGERSAQALLGSQVTFSIQANKPLKKATLMVGQKAVADADVSQARAWLTVSPQDSQTYHFDLIDEVGLEDKRPTLFSIRTLRDEPPRARLKVPGVGEMITPEAELPLEIEFSDTYGLASVGLVFQVIRDDSREGTIALTDFESGQTVYTHEMKWNVTSETLTPGDRLTLAGRALDFDDVSGPNVGRSAELTFRVVTREELLSELARREQEMRQDLEHLIDIQEQVRSALLSLIAAAQTDSTSTEFLSKTANLERKQRSLFGSLNVMRQQLEQVFGEYKINQLATQALNQRLGDGVVEPVGRLVKRDLVTAVDQLRSFFRTPTAEMADRADKEQVAVLSQMRSILANMVEFEGYQEAVNMLRDILRLQNELRTETLKSVQEQGKGLFDD